MSVIASLRSDPLLSSPEAEQMVLGALLMNDGLVSVVAQNGGADLFDDPVHADLFRRIEAKYAAGALVSPVTIKADVEGTGLLDDLGGPAYLARLAFASPIPNRDAMRGYAEMLGELSRKRVILRAIGEAQSALARGEDDADAIMARLEGSLIQMEVASRTHRPVSMLKAVVDAMDTAAAAKRGETAGLVRSGVTALDRIVPGFYPGELTLLGGRPSMGKTAVALAMALNVARAGHGVAIASLEMTPETLASRAISEATAAAGNAVPYINLRNGNLTPDQWEAVNNVARDVGELPITFLPRAYSDIGALVAGTRQIMRGAKNTKLLIVDYAQLLKAPGRSRYDEITAISMALKGLAVSLNIPVIALSQLSRQLESRDDKRPQMSDLRESGQLEQDADNVLFCYRPEYYLDRKRPQDENDLDAMAEWQDAMHKAKNRLEIIVAKQRMGEIGTAKCMFAAATGAIWDALDG